MSAKVGALWVGGLPGAGGLMAGLNNARPQQGAQLAGEVCSACQGESGVSATAELPSLAGQSSAAIYNQLHD